MTPPPQLGLGVGLPRGGMVNPYLLDQNLLLASQYEPGGWLYENHSRDTGATVVDENGNVVWAPENLFLNSDEIDIGVGYWYAVSGSVGTAQTMEDGAELYGYIGDVGTGNKYIGPNGNNDESGLPLGEGMPVTKSFSFAKGSAGYIYTQENTDGSANRSFINATTGVVTTLAAGHTIEVEDKGDYWRVHDTFVVGNTPTGFQNILGPSDDGATVNPAGDGSTVMLYAGQFQLTRAHADRVHHSTTTSRYHAPRLQHDSAGNPLGYLHEPQATKKAMSSYPGDYTKAGVIGGESATSLVGLKTYEWIANTNTTVHRISTGSFTAVAGTTYARSFFAKSADYRYVAMWSTITGSTVVFDLQTGTVARTTGSAAGVMEEYKDGVYRCAFVQTVFASVSLVGYIWFSNDPNSNYNDSYAGDGTSIGYIAGINAEEDLVTSFLPNDGSGEITRQADGLDPVSIQSLGEGMMYFEARINPNVPLQNKNSLIGRAYLDDDNEVYLNTRTAKGDRITTVTRSGGSASTPEPDAPAPDGSQFRKIAFTWGLANRLYVDGTSYAVADEATNPTGLDKFKIGPDPAIPNSDNGLFLFKRARLSTRNWSDSELQNLTS